MRYSLLIAVCLLGGNALADTLIMKNGDVLTGKILRKTKEKVRIQPAQSDEVRVPFENIKEFSTTDPVTILYSDGHVEERVLKYVAGGEPEGERAITAATLINPDDAALGKGFGQKGHINFSLRAETGTAETETADIDAAWKLRYKKHRLDFMLDWQTDEIDGQEAGEKWLGGGNYRYYLSGRTYLTGAATAERDEAANLDLRDSYGLGVGYNVLRTETYTLKLELSGLRVREEYSIDEEEDSEYWAAGYGLNYSHKFLGGRLLYYIDHTANMDVDDSDKAILKLWTGVQAPITASISVTGEIKAEMDTDPVGDVDEERVTYRLKVGYIW